MGRIATFLYLPILIYYNVFIIYKNRAKLSTILINSLQNLLITPKNGPKMAKNNLLISRYQIPTKVYPKFYQILIKLLC